MISDDVLTFLKRNCSDRTVFFPSEIQEAINASMCDLLKAFLDLEVRGYLKLVGTVARDKDNIIFTGPLREAIEKMPNSDYDVYVKIELTEAATVLFDSMNDRGN